jgi:hypothetical protein
LGKVPVDQPLGSILSKLLGGFTFDDVPVPFPEALVPLVSKEFFFVSFLIELIPASLCFKVEDFFLPLCACHQGIC